MLAEPRAAPLAAVLLLLAGCGGSAAPNASASASAVPLVPHLTTAKASGAVGGDPLPLGPSGGSGWIPFDGELVSTGNPALLRDRYGRELQLPRDDVRTRQGKVELRLGARAARPGSGGQRAREIGAGAAAYDGECGGPAECVGLVRRCCGNGSVVGFCFGISDCGAGDTLPATPPP